MVILFPLVIFFLDDEEMSADEGEIEKKSEEPIVKGEKADNLGSEKDNEEVRLVENIRC